MGATLVDDIYAGALGVARAVEIDVWFHAMAQKPAVCQPGLVWPGLAWPGLAWTSDQLVPPSAQLLSIFAKTRTRGQRDLMRLAFSLRQQARAAAWRVGGPIDRGPLRSIWRPRQESNLHLRLRRSPFYPLNYGGAGAGL